MRVIAYVALSHRPQIHLGGRVARIDELAVDADHAGQGLGAWLLEHALDVARGLACVRIDVAPEIEAASQR